MSLYHKHNFFKYTFCVFREVDFAAIEGKKINFNSKSGSKYIFDELGVYRMSNHWGRASNCRWRLNSDKKSVNQQVLIGFAHWNEFYPNDEVSKLFFVSVDFDLKIVNFNHKNATVFDGKSTLRNSNQTAKVIQNIKIILNKTSWCSHLKFDNFELLQKEIIADLCFSHLSFLEIKRKHI